ncbi:peptide ABC transporter ATP-binding protein [Candidatus Marinamargulisbacteria bacterium SCGC AG-410-N11]|nr:peptide ABC transporter ATP-binding protein [Candidatus Marinamargulisbacteria bacterium SCGC AG-410-N11]
MSNSIITVKGCTYHVSVGYENIPILKNISFDIKKNVITLVNGRSGSGKTTLIHCLAGLILPQKGLIKIDNQEINKLSKNNRAKFRLKNIGLVYQSFNFLPSLSIEENIILPALLANQKKSDYLKKCEELTNQLGIQSIKKKMPYSVSGGELQRASLVRALINSPKIILADEPTGNLDTLNRDLIFDTFENIKKYRETNIIFTSHDPKAQKIADQIININDGLISSNQ